MDSGYFDRKLMVRFDNGLVGEIQLWPPSMYQASKAGGHGAYRAGRAMAPTDPRRLQAEAEQHRLCNAASAALPDGIRGIYDALAARAGQGGMPLAAIHLSAESGEMCLPADQSSPDEISAQVSDLGRKTNAAPASSSTASRASSSKNSIADTSTSTVGSPRVDGNLRLGEAMEPRDVSAAAIPPDPAIGAAQADAAEAAAGVGQPERGGRHETSR